MEQRKLNTVLEYLKSSQQGNIKTRGNKEYKKFIIDGLEYHYNKENQYKENLKRNSNTYKKTQGYKRHRILTKSAGRAIANQQIKNYAIKHKATISDKISAFKRYANSYCITNIPLEGHQRFILILNINCHDRQFLHDNPNMKLRVDDLDILFSHRWTWRSRDFWKKSLPEFTFCHEWKGVETCHLLATIENSQLKRSGYTVVDVVKTTIHYDR